MNVISSLNLSTAWIAQMILNASIILPSQPYHCFKALVPVAISVDTLKLNISTPVDQFHATAFVQELFSAPSNLSESLLLGTSYLDTTYDIYTKLCIPVGFSEGSIVEIATHGVNLDHHYWEYGGVGSEYNYVEAAVSAGHSILTYDRLGTGLSSHAADGIQDLQASTQIAVLAELVKYLRNGPHGHRFGRVVAVGHSYGSVLTAGLVATHGNIVDDVVLTGFSTYTGSFTSVFAGLGLVLVRERDPDRSDNMYMVPANFVNMLQMWFYYPHFSPPLFKETVQYKGILTLGELLTVGSVFDQPATEFTGNVFIVTGDKDFVMCGGNCYESIDGSPNLLEPARALFPAVSSFKTYIPANMGHSVNAHYGTPATYVLIQDWIAHIA